MNAKVVFLILVLIALSVFSVKYVGYVSQGSVPSSVTVNVPAEEEEPEPGPSGGAGGGRGGGDPTGGPNFILEPTTLQSVIKQGETQRRTVRVTNTGSNDLSFDVDSELIGRFMILSPNNFFLRKGESREVAVDIFATEDEIPDAYVGSIEFTAKGITKYTNVIIEVQELKPLFDIAIDLERNQYLPGEDILFTLFLTNNGDLRNFDVVVYYAIKNFDGKILTFKTESIAIDKSLSMIRQLGIPENAVFGNHVVYARVEYEETQAATSELFTVGTVVLAPFFTPALILWIIMVIIILVLLWIIFVLWRRRKREYECQRCHHKWKGKSDKVPETCPHCRSQYWNKVY
jgi:hypothetical protein